MQEDYTPDYEVVNDAYWYKRHVSGYEDQADSEFARFVRALKAEAWAEGYAAGQNDYSMESDNPYRDN